jgi:hypothetical protein
MFLPRDSLKFSVNIVKAYNFSSPTLKRNFSFVSSILLPAVTADYKQVYEKDSVSKKEKPVYYIITLPGVKHVDSMRIKFSIPDIANP